MSDLGIGWTDDPVSRYRDSIDKIPSAILVAEAVCIAHEELTDFARKVRAVSRNAVKVRKLCDEILLRRPGTPGDGVHHHGG